MDSNPRSPAYDEFGASGHAHATDAAVDNGAQVGFSRTAQTFDRRHVI